MIWTPEAIATLELMWPDHSAAYIGKALGTTKGSVIGKVNRLGLQKVRKRWKPYAQLKPKECQWPRHCDTWNPKKHTDEWCAAKVVDGKPYCKEHCRVAYRKVVR